MAKNNKGVNQLIEKLAILADQADSLFLNSKKIIVFELNKEDFQLARKQLDISNQELKRFNIDISGVEILFIEDELLKVVEDKS